MTSLKANRPVEVELGNYAVVAHPTKGDLFPYILFNGLWYEIDGVNEMTEVDETGDVQYGIDYQGFQIVFEGVKP